MKIRSSFFVGFDEHMSRLTPRNNARNLWFKDYWEDMFDCNVVDSGPGMLKNKNFVGFRVTFVTFRWVRVLCQGERGRRRRSGGALAGRTRRREVEVLKNNCF